MKQTMPIFDAPALLVIDLIEDYFDVDLWPHSQLPQARTRLTEKTNALVAWCRQENIPIIWVRQAFKPDLSDAFLHVRTRSQRYAIQGTPGAMLLPELNVADTDTVITKQRFSAFYQTNLDDVLARLGTRTLILAGITTAWCVRSTAVDAYQRDLQIVLARDCIDGFTREEHEASLQAMDGYLGPCYTNAVLFSHSA
ncbi:MAG TPA: isochorismatase family cysteine hydrolase [Rhodothermales bacterium]|nr:isochorismatase family cysteine hydrolase [Rhodothermales bacterium]